MDRGRESIAARSVEAGRGAGAGGTLLTLLLAAAASLALAVSEYVFGNRPWTAHLPGYLLIACALAAGWLVADLLWRAQIAPALPSGALPAIATRLPIWYVGGGAAYLLGLLAAKRLGLLVVYDIPVKPHFLFGAALGAAACILTAVAARAARRTGER